LELDREGLNVIENCEGARDKENRSKGQVGHRRDRQGVAKTRKRHKLGNGANTILRHMCVRVILQCWIQYNFRTQTYLKHVNERLQHGTKWSTT